jgi:hypothetical protein
MTESYQERVKEEREELNTRITKLCYFIHSDSFLGLAETKQELLERQLYVMMEYSKILKERIGLF